MNISNAINAGLFTQFVYNNYATAAPHGLNGMAVTNQDGSPIIAGANYTVKRTIYCNDLATDISELDLSDWQIIGIVAVNDQVTPNDIVIAARGTERILEWVEDAKFFPIPFKNVPGAGLTDDGFTDMYESFSFAPAASSESFIEELITELPPNAKVTVTGHSLGGALATLLSLDLAAHSKFLLNVYTLASPRTGDLTFHRLFDSIVLDCYRVVNRLDLVPKLPPPLLYFHVGDESDLVPGKDVKWTIACEHHLTTYLYLLAKLVGQQSAFPLDSDCQGSIAATATGEAVREEVVTRLISA